MQQRLNQLHPKESFICIRICSKPEQMPDAFVCPVIYSGCFFFPLVIVKEISNLHRVIIVDCLSSRQNVSIFQG